MLLVKKHILYMLLKHHVQYNHLTIIMILIIIFKSKILRVNLNGLHFHAHLNSLCDNQLNRIWKTASCS